MDHVRIFDQIRSRKNLELALHYALHDRRHADSYFDYFEMEYVINNKEKILDEIFDELKDQEKYIQRPAYAYYPPKTDLCYRRMIYIPFKDLVIRYAFVIVLAELLDNDLSSNCFAYRRAKGEQAKLSLLEDYSKVSWPNFCNWQYASKENNKVLLRTDVSSFYDSISHHYLAKIIADELSVSMDTPLMKLFKKLLNISVISYSQKDEKVTEREVMKQGLPIGNSTEGFLANIYLKRIDEVMQEIDEIEFGRYNDDMRVFGKERKDVLNSVLILQQALLTKCLNLNSGKTEIAENKEKMEELRSKTYDVYGYHIVEELSESGEDILDEHIDRHFDEFDMTFEPNAELKENKDAKNYCKFLSSEKLLSLPDRVPEHLEKLEEILIRWGGSSRHAIWLIVQSAFYNGISKETKEKAREVLFNSLQNEKVNFYAKYRLVHHLVKLRDYKVSESRFLDKLSKEEKERLHDIMLKFLEQPAFELNIIGLYTLKVMGASANELKKYIQDYIPKPVGEPIKNVLLYNLEPTEVSKSIEMTTTEEPDNLPAPY